MAIPRTFARYRVSRRRPPTSTLLQAAVRPAHAPQLARTSRRPRSRSPASATSTSTRAGEQHKAAWPALAFHQFNQFRAEGKVKLFGEYGGYGPGSKSRLRLRRRRGAVNLWFFDHPARAACSPRLAVPSPSTTWRGCGEHPARVEGRGALAAGQDRSPGPDRYIPFPTRCAASNQSFTPGGSGQAARCRLAITNSPTWQTGVASM